VWNRAGADGFLQEQVHDLDARDVITAELIGEVDQRNAHALCCVLRDRAEAESLHAFNHTRMPVSGP
jgi:hypothetical protein